MVKEDVTQKWLDHPDDKRRLCKALAAIYQGQDEESAAWKEEATTQQAFSKRNPQSHRPAMILQRRLNVNDTKEEAPVRFQYREAQETTEGGAEKQ